MSCRFHIGNLGLSSGKIPNIGFGDDALTTSSSNYFKPINLRTSRVCSSLPLIAKYFRENSAETKSQYGPSSRQLIPNTSQVESLITEICDSTSITEFELKREGFQLYVARDLNGRSGNSPAPPDPTTLNNALTNTNGSVTAPPSLSITKPVCSSEDLYPSLDKASDESLVILRAPTVGLFRRSRTIKGKRVPPPCKEKQMVKEGQVLCYIEQLGCERPVECDVAGEVVKIIRQDGDTVGYRDGLMAILPATQG